MNLQNALVRSATILSLSYVAIEGLNIALDPTLDARRNTNYARCVRAVSDNFSCPNGPSEEICDQMYKLSIESCQGYLP